MTDVKRHLRQIANLKSHEEIPAYVKTIPDHHRQALLDHIEQVNHKISRDKTGDGQKAVLLYHGTPNHETISTHGFKLGKGRRSGFLGSEKEVDNHGVFLSSSKPLANFFGENRAKHRSDTKTLQVYANLGNTLDMENTPSHIKKKALDLVNRYEGTRKNKLSLNDHHWVLDRHEFVDHVKAHGYHSVKFPEAQHVRKLAGVEKNAAHTYMVFDPNRLSVHKNHISSLQDLHTHAKEYAGNKVRSESVRVLSFLEFQALK
jgi:hypothetical protein